MARATAQQVAQMDQAQAEVLRLLEAAEERAWLALKTPDFLRTSAQEHSVFNIEAARNHFEQWTDGAAGLRKYALAGQTDLGEPYSVQDWLDFGKGLGELLAEEAGRVLALNAFTLYTPVGALFSDTAQAAAQVGVKAETTVRQAAHAAAEFVKNPPELPTTWKAVAWVAGGTLVAGVAAYFLSQVTPLVQLLTGGEER